MCTYDNNNVNDGRYFGDLNIVRHPVLQLSNQKRGAVISLRQGYRIHFYTLARAKRPPVDLSLSALAFLGIQEPHPNWLALFAKRACFCTEMHTAEVLPGG